MSAAQAIHTRADWRRIEQLYRQLRLLVNDSSITTLPHDVTGSLAANLARVIAHYDGAEDNFRDDLFLLFAEIEQLNPNSRETFRYLYCDKRFDRFTPYNATPPIRRRPKPFEAAIETARRMIDLNSIRDALSASNCAAILGGSLSYGRFYNVCGTVKDSPSDVDLLLVLPDYKDLPSLIAALESLEFIDDDSLESMRSRAKSFEVLQQGTDFGHLILSHKLKAWASQSDPYLDRYSFSGDYAISLHIFSLEMFRYMLMKDIPILRQTGEEEFCRPLSDYREARPTRDYIERSFSGLTVTSVLNPVNVEGGCIATVPVCRINEQRYYPGLHQNLVLPQFEIRWEHPACRLYLPVLAFKWKLSERLREERRLRPFEHQVLSLAHSRFDVFAPHVTTRANNE